MRLLRKRAFHDNSNDLCGLMPAKNLDCELGFNPYRLTNRFHFGKKLSAVNRYGSLHYCCVHYVSYRGLKFRKNQICVFVESNLVNLINTCLTILNWFKRMGCIL